MADGCDGGGSGANAAPITAPNSRTYTVFEAAQAVARLAAVPPQIVSCVARFL